LSQKSQDDISNRISLMLNEKNFITLLGDITYKEQALSFNGNIFYIDLLIEDDYSYTIIDYKSSKAYADKHISQVRNYIEAISKIGKKNVYAYLCYLLEDKCEIVKV